MLARYSLWSCVSVRLFVCRKPVLWAYRNDWMDRAGVWRVVFRLSFTTMLMCYRKFEYLQKIGALPSGTLLSQTLDLENFATTIDSVVNKTHRRSSLLNTLATVDAYSLLHVGRP